jgi:predicted GNAT superfamily acetyltransferase
MSELLEIRECTTLDHLAECVNLQREVFALPEVELSPVRHFIVTRNAGGFTLGAFDGEKLAGFTLSVPAYLRGERAYYSHMTGVRPEYQSHGLGAKLKWAQRNRALAEGVKYIKWTFEPIKARNAYFNLEKLGATVREYQVNFYGTDYAAEPGSGKQIGLQSDRLFAEWELDSAKVNGLAAGERFIETREPQAEIETVNDWTTLVEFDPAAALELQLLIRGKFEAAFASGLIGGGFRRDDEKPVYLLYSE